MGGSFIIYESDMLKKIDNVLEVERDSNCAAAAAPP